MVDSPWPWQETGKVYERKRAAVLLWTMDYEPWTMTHGLEAKKIINGFTMDYGP